MAKFSPDGKLLATAGNDRRVVIWEIKNRNQPRVIAQHPGAIADLAWSHDGSQLATAGFENLIRIYDVASGKERLSLVASCNDNRAVVFSPDDQWVAGGGRDGIVGVWQVRDGAPVAKLPLHRQRVRQLAITAKKQLVTCGDDRLVRICLLYTSPSPRDLSTSRMPSSA